MRIDAHQHFWTYNDEEFAWMTEDMHVIRRDFLAADLKPEISSVGIDAVVSVQARQTLEETRFLLEQARRNDFIRAVVGWVPLVSPSVRGDLEELAADPRLKACRHVLQGEADERYMLRDDFNAGVKMLEPLGLAYDILIFERHLPQTLEFVDRHPCQVFVLDHIAKPRIKDGAVEPWKTHLLQLAQRPNVYCKISGMVTEADHQNWTEEQLRPYFDTVLSAFGPGRLMFGSDWPLCLLASSYQRWYETVQRQIARLSASEQQRILGGTAVEAYKL